VAHRLNPKILEALKVGNYSPGYSPGAAAPTLVVQGSSSHADIHQ